MQAFVGDEQRHATRCAGAFRNLRDQRDALPSRENIEKVLGIRRRREKRRKEKEEKEEGKRKKERGREERKKGGERRLVLQIAHSHRAFPRQRMVFGDKNNQRTAENVPHGEFFRS